MSKHVSTGFMRQAQRRKAKLKLGNQKLTKYERFIKIRNADQDAIAKAVG